MCNTHFVYLAALCAILCTRRSAHLIRTRSVRLYPNKNVRPNMKKSARTCGETSLKHMLKTSVKLTMSTPAKSTGRPTLMVTKNGRMTLQHARSSQRPSASLWRRLGTSLNNTEIAKRYGTHFQDIEYNVVTYYGIAITGSKRGLLH